ncbi:MAG: aminoacyl-tRNA hydrolase [Desulfobulbaceae bacterium DB1]|nr:MAG: aminoacyl-tRNA hydrolase [Desulfobulbaceae bacterium DB1]
MFLVVGLGNPGEKYFLTRHNVGFLYVDYLAEQLHADFSVSKWQADVARTTLDNHPLVLVKPQTFMNLSGTAVLAAASFYKIPPEKIIVIHDDLDMPLGRLKIVVNRGAGGHNGIRSLISHIGNKDFVRIKAGIGRPANGQAIEGYVLQQMTQAELGDCYQLRDLVFDAVRLIVTKGVEAAMNHVNSLKIDN